MKKPTFKDPDIDISFRSKTPTKNELAQFSDLIKKEKKKAEKMQLSN